MTVLGKHLYSTPTVAIRELVQNAHDSIIRRRMEAPEWGEPARITVTGDQARGVIRVTDTGAGLTDEEIHRFLATVGVGYTRTLRERNDDAGLIGMFGLGFLSAFVLAADVVLVTTSYQDPSRGWRYQSATGEKYSLTPVAPRPVGTEVILTLRDSFSHLASQEVLRQILSAYCILLKEPLYLAGEEVPLNPDNPPWREPEGNTRGHPVWLQRKRLEFARRFDGYFEPVCTLPVAPPRDDPEVDAVGLLWVQDGATYGTSDNRQLSVFGRGMLLDDDARDLLPPWAGFISGVIESNLLTPTASREDLQKDDCYHATREALEEALITGLAAVPAPSPKPGGGCCTAITRRFSARRCATTGCSISWPTTCACPPPRGICPRGICFPAEAPSTLCWALRAGSKTCCFGCCACPWPAATATPCCPFYANG